MTLYQKLFCGEPIRRKEYALRMLLFLGFTLGSMSLLGFVGLPDSIDAVALVILLTIIFLLAVCQLFWLYWRIRDVVHTRDYAALAMLATLLLPLVALLWFVIPSKKIEDQ